MADNNGAEPVYGNGYPADAPRHDIPVYSAQHSEQASHDPQAQSGPIPPPVTDAPEPPYTAPYPPYPSDDPPPAFGIAPNLAASLAYLTVVPAIIFLILEPYRSHPLVRFHSWQSVFFFLAAAIAKVVLGVLGAIFPPLLILLLSSIISLILLAAWLVALLQAFRGVRFRLPLIGDFADKAAA